MTGTQDRRPWEDDDDLVVVVGAGLTGLAVGLRASIEGRPVVILEADALVGGAAAYSGGQVWVGANHVAAAAGFSDDLAMVETYIRSISSDVPEVFDEEAMRTWIATAPTAARYWETVGAIEWEIIPTLADYHAEAAGATPGGRYLTSVPVQGEDLGQLRHLLRDSPYFPVGRTYAEMLEQGRRRSLLDRPRRLAADTPAFGTPDALFPDRESDLLTFGPGVVGSFLRRLVKQDRVVVRTGVRVSELMTDENGAVIGAASRDAHERTAWSGPVVLATSTFDWNPDLVREFHGIEPEDFGSVAPRTLRGDGIQLARAVGGRTVALPVTTVPMKPGWIADNETGYAYGAEYAMPHCMIVDATGRRFSDDSYWVDIISKVAARGSSHRPFFLIWDCRHHAKYGLGATPPGGRYPPGVVSTAQDLATLAQELGIDQEGLVETARRFSDGAARGEDPDFHRGTVPYVRAFVGDPEHRPNPVLGPVDRPPFFGMRLKLVSTGIGSSGLDVDSVGRVRSEKGGAIDGLYAVGSCVALTSSGGGYNSGFALGRGLTLAYLAGGDLCRGGGDREPADTA